jgi:hypothetical protein
MTDGKEEWYSFWLQWSSAFSKTKGHIVIIKRLAGCIYAILIFSFLS